jgi:hypothetical protein
LTDKIVYASPRATFASSLTSQLAASSKRILFSRNAASAAACSVEAGDLGEIDGSILYLSDAPEVTDMLLRAWQGMEESKKISQGQALANALSASGYSDFGFLSCGTRLSEEPEIDRVLSSEAPPGMAEKFKKQVRKASESSWVDRFRAEASKERRAATSESAVSERQRQEAWQKKSSEWKDIWAQRVADLEKENNYNATEVREERRRQRMERRKQNKGTRRKHVRYLPAEVAAKVKAKEDKWEADQAKQKADDMEKAEARREAFKHQVEEAQNIIENKRKQTLQQAEQELPADDELSAA